MENKILVVDDEAAVRDMLGQAFGDAGYTVLSAASGEEALALLDKETVPVMFLDLKIPGMTGIELCRRIRENHPVSCIYAVTGYASLFDLAKCREAGFDDCFIKPVDLMTLFEAAQEAFKRTAGRAKRQQEEQDGAICVNADCSDDTTAGVKGCGA